MNTQTETSIRNDLVMKAEGYAEFFREFNHTVTKTSLSGAYEPPVDRWLSNRMLRERRRDGKISCLMALRSIDNSEPVVDFTGEAKCWMDPGDLFIERIAFVHQLDAENELADIIGKNRCVFIELWEEDPKCQQLVAKFNLKWLCTKILQTDELSAVYYHGQRSIDVDHKTSDETSICKLKIEPFEVHECIQSLELIPRYINHYSKYNKDNSWSAV